MNGLRKMTYNIFTGYSVTLIVSWTVWVVVNIMNYASLPLSELKRALVIDFAENVLEAVLLYAFSFLSCKLLVRYLWTHSKEGKALLVGLTSHVLATALFSLGLALLYNLALPSEKDIFYHVLLSDFFVLVVFSSVNISMSLVNKSREEERDRIHAESTARRNEILALQTELDMLSLQTNNHFIFNSFSTAAGLVRHQPEAAEVFIRRLSSMYRYMTRNSSRHVVAIDEELDFVDNYIQLLQDRYAGLAINLSTKLRSVCAFVPPAAIQSLIENAVKHNGHGPEDPLVVNVSLEDESIVVSNNVIFRSDESVGAHIGLDNLRKRYGMLTKKQVRVDTDGQTFSVSLPLLFEEDLSYESSDN